MGNLVLDRTILGQPKEKFWLSYIHQRIKKNKNFLGFISGQTGSGKSWSSLSICESLDSEFSIERVVFSGMELMQLINSGKLKRGSAIVFEESGVEMNARNWSSITNKMLNYLMQTFRHRGFILILNSPYMDFVDSATRKLFHAELQTQGINAKTNECILKPQLIQYNGRSQKFYFKRLRVITINGVIPVDRWNVHKPSQALIDAYEQKKRDYTDRLNHRIMEELEKVENKGNTKKILTDIQQGVLDLMKEGKNIEEIATIKNRSLTAINTTMRLIKQKGYTITPIYDCSGGRKVTGYEIVEPGQKVQAHNIET